MGSIRIILMLLCLNTTDLESSKFQYNLTSKYYLIWPNLVENQLSLTWNHDFSMTVYINQSSTEQSTFLSKSSKKIITVKGTSDVKFRLLSAKKEY